MEFQGHCIVKVYFPLKLNTADGRRLEMLNLQLLRHAFPDFGDICCTGGNVGPQRRRCDQNRNRK